MRSRRGGRSAASCPQDTIEDIEWNLTYTGTPTQGVGDTLVGDPVFLRWYWYVEGLVVLNRTEPSSLPGGCIRGLAGVLPDFTDDACSEIFSRSSFSACPAHTTILP